MKKEGVLLRLRALAAVLFRELRAWLFSFFLMLFLLLILNLSGVLRLQAFFEGDLDFDDIRSILIGFGVALVLVRLGIAAIPGLVRWIEDVLDSPRPGERTLEGGESLASPHESPLTATIAGQLRLRATRLRRIANLLLGIIIVLLACGFFAFQGADLAAARWNSFMTGPLENEVSNRRNGIQDLFYRLADENHQEPGKANQIFNRNQTQNPDKATLGKELDFEEADLARLEERLDLLSPSKSQTVFLVSTLSTKIGSILLLIFLVQLLSSLYRYHIRLAVFCDSRADFLQMLSSSFSLSGEALATFLSTEKSVEIDSAPLSPIQQATELLQTAFALSKKV
jgi:hypothetical protein